MQPLWRHELVALQVRSDQTLTALDTACESLRELEDELAQFLDHYYSQIGASIDRLTELERERDRLKYGLSETRSPEETTLPPPLPALDNEVKTLYRLLVRRCHPDVAGEDAESAQSIRLLNDAYARRNIGELWKINREMGASEQDNTPAETIKRLEAQWLKMQTTLETVENRRETLKQSPAYALMQRAFQLRLCGEDFIATVQQHLAVQIDRTRRDILRTRLQELHY